MAFECSGDAIQCAIARHTFELKCRQEQRVVENQSCESEEAFVCRGDAIDCAIARRQRELACAMHANEEVLEHGRKVLAGEEDENGPAEGTRGNPTLVDIGTIEVASGGGGSCPGSVSAFGFSVDFSQVCFVFDAMGWALVIAAWIIAARIIGGAV